MKISDKTILLVSDNPAVNRIAREALETAGYRVIVKTEGGDALSLFDQGEAVDLVIINYHIPGMSGLEFMEELRKESPSIPVVLLNTNGDIETYLKAFNLGAYEYINRPLDRKELSAIVTSLLSGEITCRMYGGDITCDDNATEKGEQGP